MDSLAATLMKAPENSDVKPDQNAAPKLTAWKRAAVYTKTMNAFMDNVSMAASEAPSDFDTRKKIKYGTAYQAAWGIFSEYCNNSTIHGIKYLGEQKRPCLERLFWIFVFLLSIYACASLTMNIWDKWDNNPVIVSFAEKSTPVWQIPFPSVTVCPETKAMKKVFNFTRLYWDILFQNNYTETELEYMDTMTQVCDVHLTIDAGFPFSNETANATAFVERLREMITPFNETYRFCKWRNEMSTCEALFSPVLTEEGICYSYNSLDATEVYRDEAIHDDYMFKINYQRKPDWSLEDGFDPDAGTVTFPERVLAAGARAGLFLLLQGFQPDYDQLCRGPVQGFKVLLHTPGEVPQVSKHYLRIPFASEIIISIKPNIITTSDGLKHYKPSRRQCFFQTERYLRYFKVYTQNNCELECLANFTLTKCGCVKFSMPRNINTPVCGAYHIKCMDEAEDELLLEEFQQGLRTSALNYRGQTECNCLPACTSVVYNSEISQADFDYKRTFDAFGEGDYFEKNPGAQMARLSIYFKENQFLTSKRSELYGTTDFLANCGGLLGLFMGVSTLSLVELLYFCTVRLITNLKMRHRKRKELMLAAAMAPEIIVDEPGVKGKEA